MLTLEKKGLISDLSPYLKKLEKEEHSEPKTATKRKKQKRKQMKQKPNYQKRSRKLMSLVRLTKRKREKTEPHNFKNETKDITTDPKPVKKKNQGILQLYGIWSHHFMGNRGGNSGNSVRLYFGGLQNHCRG